VTHDLVEKPHTAPVAKQVVLVADEAMMSARTRANEARQECCMAEAREIPPAR
jgi:hypothetical protein